MHTYIPFEDYALCAKSLDNFRLQSVLCFSTILIRSLTGVYEPNKRTGQSGWASNTVGKFWTNHELSLAYYAKALAAERIIRPLPSDNQVQSLNNRKKEHRVWQDICEFLEDKEYPPDNPALVSDEEFHSGFRSLLLYKGIQDETFKAWKRGDYLDHACTKALLPRKSSWITADYERIWEFFGQPRTSWYEQLGWTDEPTDKLYFYTENRVPHMKKELQRKKDKPYLPFLKPRIINNG